MAFPWVARSLLLGAWLCAFVVKTEDRTSFLFSDLNANWWDVAGARQ
jgi:hypothetical protein